MKILSIASECAPIAKVGGLADVVGSLPGALKSLGADAAVTMPYYQSANLPEDPTLIRKKNPIRFGGQELDFELWQSRLSFDVPVYLIKHNDYFGKNIYFEKDASPNGNEKEASSFLFLSLAAVKTAEILGADILHCHDWHTAMIPWLAKNNDLRAKTVLTIHNLEYQGIYESAVVNKILETDFSGSVNCLRQGILGADLITTVSPNYAREILTEEFGAKLQNDLKKRRDSLFGMLNGIDIEKFDPKRDPHLKSHYSAESPKEKEANKTYLQGKCFGKFGKSDSGVPIFGMVSRLADQKGFDLIIETFDALMKENLQFIILGQGLPDYENFFKSKAREFKNKFFIRPTFDNELASQIYAGADIFLMPSRFEPCGLGQMIAMRYGTIPVGRAVGGIKDTVENDETGFLFEKYEPREFLNAVKKALFNFHDKKRWQKMQRKAMLKDFSWTKSAKQYLRLFTLALEPNQRNEPKPDNRI